MYNFRTILLFVFHGQQAWILYAALLEEVLNEETRSHNVQLDQHKNVKLTYVHKSEEKK